MSEFNLLKQVNHPHIIRLYGACSQDGEQANGSAPSTPAPLGFMYVVLGPRECQLLAELQGLASPACVWPPGGLTQICTAGHCYRFKAETEETTSYVLVSDL